MTDTRKDALTPRQAAILNYMCRYRRTESGAEMANALWNTGVFTSYEQGQRTANQLVKKGLAIERGFTFSGARCYAPTQSGINYISGKSHD